MIHDAKRLQGPCRIVILVLTIQILVASSGICLAGSSGSRGQTIYVPAHSAIRIGDRGLSFELVSTLFIRNTDLSSPITILSIDNFDSNGKKYKSHLQKSINLDPLASADFYISPSDTPDGLASSFIVKWRSKELVTEPIVENVVVGTRGGQGVSFVCLGKVIKDSPEQ